LLLVAVITAQYILHVTLKAELALAELVEVQAVLEVKQQPLAVLVALVAILAMAVLVVIIMPLAVVHFMLLQPLDRVAVEVVVPNQLVVDKVLLVAVAVLGY
jgi:hypothetical protein